MMYVIKYLTPFGGKGTISVPIAWLEANATKFFKKMKKVKILNMKVSK